MKTRTLKPVLALVILAMSMSGCASLSLNPTGNAKIPVGSGASSLEMQFGMARLLERNGRLEEARQAYLRILSLQQHPDSLHRLGVTAIRQNRLDAGLKHLTQAIDAGNPSAELLGDLGYAQFLAGDLPAAEMTLKKAVTLDPSQKRNVNNLAIVIGKQDRLGESFQLFRQAGAEAEALANLAFIQAQSNDFGKAQANYNRALDLDPKLRIAAVGLMEVHKHIRTRTDRNADRNTARSYDREYERSVEPARQPIASERIAQAPPVEPVARRAPRSRSVTATDRVIATIQRPIQLPGRAPTNPIAAKPLPKPAKPAKKVAGKLGTGTFQPPAFRNHGAGGTIAQASYQEAVIDQSPPR